jgi:hypothetical protein
MDRNPKWEFVENVDYARRTAHEWAKIYLVELLEEPIDNNMWSEFEWAYNLFTMRYRPDTIDMDAFSELEQRAMELRRDVFMGANLTEKNMLNEAYVETDWVRKRLTGF